jgi:hypothetical protein
MVVVTLPGRDPREGAVERIRCAEVQLVSSCTGPAENTTSAGSKVASIGPAPLAG